MDHPDVVLVDADDNPIGTAPKAEVHTGRTPLHRAFSCHLFDSSGRVLFSRRALGKKTWPGVWTNAFCGHSAQDEDRADALVRHGAFEMGLDIDRGAVEMAIPSFAYRAQDVSGIVEHEICPVFTLRMDASPVPNPDEVMDFAWLSPETLDHVVAGSPWLISPWSALQWAELRGLPSPRVPSIQRL